MRTCAHTYPSLLLMALSRRFAYVTHMGVCVGALERVCVALRRCCSYASNGVLYDTQITASTTKTMCK